MSLREAAQQALEALELGYGAAKSEADQFHAAMSGYKPHHHAQMDADVQQIATAITALRTALDAPEPRNQCGETCERAKLCAVCTRGLTDETRDKDWDEVEALRESLREHMAEIHRLRAAGRQALGAMDDLHRTGDTQVFDMYGCEATEALRAALEPVTDCHEKEGDKLSPPSDHILDATKMMASVREDRTVEPVAYVTGYSKGYAVVQPVDRSLLMPVGMALYRFSPKREPLTDEEIKAAADKRGIVIVGEAVIAFARAIEQAHGIGGEK